MGYTVAAVRAHVSDIIKTTPLTILGGAHNVIDYKTLISADDDHFAVNETASAWQLVSPTKTQSSDARLASLELFIYGFCLILIPTATILGNLLVIVSVLRFKILHSAINFFILGLAVADLFVALFVMPYAVYVYMQGGYWYLGELMCDIYSASDVACSTASILLLAVISFDRYRAVSQPIKYSRQSRNIKRVICILLSIWFFSLALASPIVLGVNNRPPDVNPYECRFYNPVFSIVSSVGSFVIPCFFILFVYIRIMLALRQRERAAKARRIANMNAEGMKNKFTLNNANADHIGHNQNSGEAGEVVAGPAVNMMLMALPSMSRRIRRFERHKAAIDHAGGEFDRNCFDSNGPGELSSVLTSHSSSSKSPPPIARKISPASGRLLDIMKAVSGASRDDYDEDFFYEDDDDDYDDFDDEEDEFDSDEDGWQEKPLANIHNMMQTIASASNYEALICRNSALRKSSSEITRKRSTLRRKRAKMSTTSFICTPVKEFEKLINHNVLASLGMTALTKKHNSTAHLMGSALSMVADVAALQGAIPPDIVAYPFRVSLSYNNLIPVDAKKKDEAVKYINSTDSSDEDVVSSVPSTRSNIELSSQILSLDGVLQHNHGLGMNVKDVVSHIVVPSVASKKLASTNSIQRKRQLLSNELYLVSANAIARHLPSLSICDIFSLSCPNINLPNTSTITNLNALGVCETSQLLRSYVDVTDALKKITHTTFGVISARCDAITDQDYASMCRRTLSCPSLSAMHEHDLMISSSPCSSVDSLSENLNVVTNDFVSEAPTNASRRSSEIDSWSPHRQFRVSIDKIAYTSNDNGPPKSAKQKTHFGRLKRSVRKRARRAFAVGGSDGSITAPSQRCHSAFPQARVRPIVPPEYILPSIFRRFSRHGPLFFRESFAGTFGVLNRGARNSEKFSDSAGANKNFHAFCAEATTRRRESICRHHYSNDNGAVIAVRPAVFRAYGCPRHVVTSVKNQWNERCRAFSVDIPAKCIANSLASEHDCAEESTRRKRRNDENGRKRSIRTASNDTKRKQSSTCHGADDGYLTTTNHDNSSALSVDDMTRMTAVFSPLLEEDFVDEEGVPVITTAKLSQIIPTPACYGNDAFQSNAIAPLAQNEKDSSLVNIKSYAAQSLPSQSPLRRGSSAIEFSSDCFTKNSSESSTIRIRSNIFSDSDISCTKPLLEQNGNAALSSQYMKGATFVNCNTIDTTKSMNTTVGHGHCHRRGGHYHYSNQCEAPTLRHSFESTTYNASTGSNRIDCRHRFFERNHSSGRLECGCPYSVASVVNASISTTAAAKANGNAAASSAAKALAVKMMKKTVNRKESSLKRKVTKSQRKEKRATKTLGIVVGIFLVCWVPFFTINILNAVCVTMGVSACEIGFAPFFYATWIGYMNSFMNPIIYTIFNTEFRRAFKSLILGRNAMKRRANRERKM